MVYELYLRNEEVKKFEMLSLVLNISKYVTFKYFLKAEQMQVSPCGGHLQAPP